MTPDNELAAYNSSEVSMNKSKQIGGLVGPTIVAILLAEFPLVQPHLYDTQIPPVVYISGTLMFVGGLAIVRAHNLWAQNWTLLITLSGWFFLLLGLFRMFFAGAYLQGSQNTGSATFMVLEAILLLVGLIITFKSCSRGEE
jgi:hypothetical protein